MKKKLARTDAAIEALINDPNYDVRADGTIWRRIKTGRAKQTGKCRNGCGYHYVTYKYVPLRLHRIIYAKHLGNLLPDKVVNHKDGNRSNNHPSNLEQISHRDNIRHGAEVLGNGPGFRLSAEVVSAIRADRLKGASYRALAKKYRTTVPTAHRACNSEHWTDWDTATEKTAA